MTKNNSNTIQPEIVSGMQTLKNGKVLQSPVSMPAMKDMESRIKEVCKYKSFEDVMQWACEAIRTDRKRTLLLRYELGGQLYVILEGARYGERTIKDIADRLGFSDTSLYDCITLFKIFDRHYLTTLAENDIGLHTALKLSRITDPKVRLEATRKILSGEMSLDQLETYKMLNVGEVPKPAEAAPPEASTTADGLDKGTHKPALKTKQKPPVTGDKAYGKSLKKYFSKIEARIGTVHPTLTGSIDQILDHFDRIDSDEEAANTAEHVHDCIVNIKAGINETLKALTRAEQVISMPQARNKKK